jgi:hypothetical protein
MNEPSPSTLEERLCLVGGSISSRPFSCQILPGNRRSTESLLPDTDDDDDDDFDTDVGGDDDMCGRNQNVPVSNQQGEQLNSSQTQEYDPQLHRALEIFPMANPRRIQYLLRSESLSTALLILSQELTDGRPSDEVVGPTSLAYATTFAQASCTDQRFLLESMKEMFPKLSMEHIESTLMHNSTHQAVTMLAETNDIPEGKKTNIKSMDALPPTQKESRRSLTDCDDDTWRPNLQRRR